MANESRFLFWETARYHARMVSFLAVCLGGAFGSGGRYLIALALRGTNFPIGTLVVNVVGSLLLGVLAEVTLDVETWHPAMRLALTTGFCGGFTTYSTFNLETVTLLNDGHVSLAAVYAGTTLVSCFLAGAAGFFAARLVVG